MSSDPLSFFLDEKTASDSTPDTSFEKELDKKPFTKNPDPQSIDPGERAFAGMMAVSGSVLGKAIPAAGNLALTSALMGNSVPSSKHIRLLPTGKMSEIAAGLPTSKILGLFNVHARPLDFPEAAAKDFARFKETGEAIKHPVTKAVARQSVTIGQMMNTVDAFIDKHNLKGKGVNVHIQQGPLNLLSGSRYEPLKKRVYLPDLSKELALHELGHAADFTKGTFGKIRAALGGSLMRGAEIALPAAIIAGDQIKEMLPGTVDDKAIEFMQNHAPEIMGATIAATTLYPEAKANILALQHIAKTEGRASAIHALKRLGPSFGTYLLGAIPAIVGMSLARKYMREARKEKTDTNEMVQQQMSEIEKTSGALSWIGREAKGIGKELSGIPSWVGSHLKDIAYVGKQIGDQSRDIIKNKEVISRLYSAAKEVGTDPTFVAGAMKAALPAAMGTLYFYGTPGGKEIRKRVDPQHFSRISTGEHGNPLFSRKIDDSWREQHPFRFAGLVAAGAALSGGILSKLYSDLAPVL